MKDQIKAVTEFHDHMNISPKQDFCQRPTTKEAALAEAQYLPQFAKNMHHYSKLMEDHVGSSGKLLRCHLLVEEVAEFVEACDDNDEVLALDALTDLLYVLIGTAVMYGWDLDGAFNEVHASNMTKTPNSSDDARLRDKGDAFVPPSLEKFIR